MQRTTRFHVPCELGESGSGPITLRPATEHDAALFLGFGEDRRFCEAAGWSPVTDRAERLAW